MGARVAYLLAGLAIVFGFADLIYSASLPIPADPTIFSPGAIWFAAGGGGIIGGSTALGIITREESSRKESKK